MCGLEEIAMADVAAAVNTARKSFTPIPDAKQVGDEYVALPKGTHDGVETQHTRQTILADPKTLYGLWKNQEAFPLWQEHVVSVKMTGATTSHWVMGNPEDADGKRIEFDSETVIDIPGEKIGWKSIAGDVEQSGEVEFKARRDGRGTVVTLVQRFKVGVLASIFASVAERGPRQTVIEDLRHFKEMAEAGEIPSVKGQAHGPRGLGGGLKEWMYGETNPTPPGSAVEGQTGKAE